jgi:hypothetical protein
MPVRHAAGPWHQKAFASSRPSGSCAGVPSHHRVSRFFRHRLKLPFPMEQRQVAQYAIFFVHRYCRPWSGQGIPEQKPGVICCFSFLCVLWFGFDDLKVSVLAKSRRTAVVPGVRTFPSDSGTDRWPRARRSRSPAKGSPASSGSACSATRRRSRTAGTHTARWTRCGCWPFRRSRTASPPAGLSRRS